MESKLKRILSLFAVFFKIGAFTFGGGYAMIPLIQKETAEKKNWITDEDILDIIAIAESTPGPIAINAATFVGFKTQGFFGALAATFGVVLPSLVIITLISFVLEQFQNIPAVVFAFDGIRVAVLAMILKALMSMYKQCPKHMLSYFIMAAAFISVGIFNISVLWTIIFAAVFGVVYSALVLRRADK